ncbi:hypothetical protein [Brevibacterium picturae]|uniref:Uncharacterized protein n=1 Tax=Brevibacterium picturae TaxID=260553 RepID=A0ABP4N6P6_9MICO
MAELYRLEVSLYSDVLSEGVDAGEFTMELLVETAANKLMAMEDAYGLHFMGGAPLDADGIYRNFSLCCPIVLFRVCVPYRIDEPIPRPPSTSRTTPVI